MENNSHDKRLNKFEWVFLVFCFILFFVLSMVKPIDYAPDEIMRYDIPKYIYEHGVLPSGNNAELRDSIWGFSYAYYPCFLGPILSALFMKIVSIFTASAFPLLVAARFVSVLSGVISVYFVIKIARRTFMGKYKWLLIFPFALIPQFVFLTTYVNNDIICICGSTIIVYAWVCGLYDEWNYKYCSLLSVGIVVCALSYYNSYGWILCSILLFALSFLWKDRKKLNDKMMWKFGAYICIVVIACVSYFFIRNAILYNGDFLGMDSLEKASEQFAVEEVKPSNRETPEHLGMSITEMLLTKRYIGITWIDSTYKSFIGKFGWMDVSLPPKVYLLYTCLFGLGVIGVTGSWIQRLMRRERVGKEKRIFNVNLCIAFVIPIVLSVYYSYSAGYQPQGRYCYPMVLAFMYFVARGLEWGLSWFKNEGVKRWMIYMFGTGMIAVTIYVFMFTYVPSK